MYDYCDANKKAGVKFCMECGEEVNEKNETPLGCFACLGNIRAKVTVYKRKVPCPNCTEKTSEIFDTSLVYQL